MASTLFKTVTKLAIGGAAVYVTLDTGVWSNSNQGTRALERFKELVLPSDYIKKAYAIDDMNSTIINKWNSGVKTTFSYLFAAPELACTYTKKGMCYLQTKLNK